MPLPNQEATYNVVKSFGAKGNGVADDTAAVQAAIAAASRQPGVVLLPAGIYRISMPLTIAASGVVLRGAGVRRLVLLTVWRRERQQRNLGATLAAGMPLPTHPCTTHSPPFAGGGDPNHCSQAAG